jgi:hypothetical protein
MKHHTFWYAAAAALCAAWLLLPVHGAAARRVIDIGVEGAADSCAELRVHSTGEVARAAESFSLSKAEAPTLQVNAPQHSVIRVRGWEQSHYGLEVCKIAAAEDTKTAGDLLNAISIAHTAGRFTVSGPASDDGKWQAYVIVHAPKDASLDLETHNGPISVAGVSGTLKVRAVNGPISIHDSSGTLEANTANGPISFSGGGGDVHLNAHNGPIALKLANDVWDGPGLQASTVNGPVSLRLPDKFRSGVHIESSGHGPIHCGASACAGASMNAAPGRRIIEWKGTNGTVRVSTDNGPIAVSGGKPTHII